MVVTRRKRSTRSSPVRCFTRALKNARYLQQVAPDLFATDPTAQGFGTGVPMKLLRNLHRIPPNSIVLKGHKAVAGFLRTNRLPVPGRKRRDPLFNGTIHFAQVTFQTSRGKRKVSTTNMKQIVQYAQHAIVPISEYAAQYGPNAATISPTLLTYSVKVPSGKYTDKQLQGWVNDMATRNKLPTNSCIFVVSPKGVSIRDVGANAGYHSKAHISYIVAGVWASRLTLKDSADVYAMVVSHEIAEMIVDPNVRGTDPEVCDPCDLNCGPLNRCYFEASDKFLGGNQASPPGGFPFIYYTCAVVKPAAAANCPASSANCSYAP